VRKRTRAGWLLIAVVALASCTAEPPEPGPSSPSSQEDSTLASQAHPLPLEEVAAFGAVATINAGSNCTGTLVDTRVAAGPAYVLTAGRCVGDLSRPAQATTLGGEGAGTAEFFRAEGNLGATVTVDVAEIAYSTMRSTDTAIVRLNATLGELEALGVRPIPITDREPGSGDDVVNVSVPVQDLEPDAWVMRRAGCSLGDQHTLIESPWLWFAVWSNDCPGIVHGSSGSPLFTVDRDGDPGEIVAMISTTSSGVIAADGGACWAGRPCQVTDAGPVMVEETSYAQSVAGIGRCFDATTGGLTVAGTCPLVLSDVWVEEGGGPFQGDAQPDASGRLPEASFVGTSVGILRTVLVPLKDGAECGRKETYVDSAARVLPRVGEPWEAVGVLIAVDLPVEEGFYLLCGVRAEAYGSAASVIFEVDRTPPVLDAGAKVERLEDGSVVVRPYLHPPELSTVRFTWGAMGTVDCEDTAAFQDSSLAPLTIHADDLPAEYCIYGRDVAGNATPVTTIDIRQT